MSTRLASHALGALLVWALPATAVVRADAPSGSTAVMVTATAADDPAEVEEIAKHIQEAVRARHVSIIGDASDRIVAKHSAPAVRPAEDRLASLRAELDAVTRHLALGELEKAIKRMKTIETLHHDALDFLSREAKQARKLFEACVMTGYLLHQNGRIEEGKEQLRMCAASFPGYELHKEVFTDAVRTLYREVTTNQDRRAAWLLVEGVDAQASCFVRLNGIKVGHAPLQIRTRPSTVRVQLECGSGLGRIHTLRLKMGEQKVTIDPNLEAALDTSTSVPMLLHLTHVSDAVKTRQLTELGRAIGVDYVVQLDRDGRGWALGLLDVETGVITARVKVHKDHTGAAVGRLFAAPRRELASGDGAEPDGEPEALAVGAPPTSRSLIGTGQVHGAYFAVVGTVWLLSPLGSMMMINSRRDKVGTTQTVAPMSDVQRVMDENQGITREYNRDAILGFVFAGVPSLWWTVSSMFLPDTGDMPWYSWAAGVVGGALFGVGLATTLGSEHCGLAPKKNPLTNEVEPFCRHLAADEYFGPLIMTHAVAPLSIFFSYAIANMLDLGSGNTGATVSVDNTSANLTFYGRF